MEVNIHKNPTCFSRWSVRKCGGFMEQQSLTNVLLIDDDLLVLDDLQSMIDWKGNGYCIVGCAHNGQQALDIMAYQSIDLIIADIEMPLMNGLEFLKEVNKANQNIVALLLTAYSRFDYAREAVALGVFNYILKFELTPSILLDNLNQMRELSIKQKQNYLYTLHQSLHQYLECGQEYGIGQLSNVSLEHKCIYIVKVNACLTFKDYEEKKQTDALNDVVIHNEALIKTLELSGVAYCASAMDITFIFTQPWDCKQLNNGIIDQIISLCQLTFGREVQAIVCSCVSPSDVAATYQIIKQKESLLFYYPLNQCIDLSDLHWKKQNESMDYLSEFDNLESLESSLIPQQIKKCLLLLKENGCNIAINYSYIRNILRHLQKLLANQVSNQSCFDDFMQWQSIANYDALETFVLKYLKQIELYAGKSYSRKVVEMMNYIQNYCEKENVLESLAQYLSMNREYMAKLFKKETGDSISNYLLDCRMKKAYQLLTHTHYKIYEIAEMCGFNSSQYFSMVFTKYYHCAPSCK